ncbi:ClpV1 family type VI secretion ATPase [Candidatus Magnetomorum sp. HK-1]|nr:ClpV1 family type VI secretion ATPase [Candidatus Magnetomorum sp. HK-1]
MITEKIEKLLDKLTPYVLSQLDAAAGFAMSKGHYEIGFEHLFLKFINDSKGDIANLLNHFDIDYKNLKSELLKTLNTYLTGNTGKPSFSPVLIDILENAWILASVDFNQDHIRSAHLMLASLNMNRNYTFIWLNALKNIINKEKIAAALVSGLENSVEETVKDEPVDESIISENMDVLKKYTVNLTDEAKKGKIDPVFSRNNEIRQMINILSRRTKNNPLLVGNPGVGKSAIVEGLALKIIEGDVPPVFQDADLLSLDLGLLQAGASVKGEFENRLKKIIQAIKDYQKPVITFIDEVHTLIGAGNHSGAGDAANILKPELARGNLHTIAATTWAEMKKYFEKDGALTRRFQPIKILEPDEKGAISILRGLKNRYANHHDIHITDKAVIASVKMSMRYITDRQLPDKAIDLMDTAAAIVSLSQHATPDSIIKITQDIATLEREKNSIAMDRINSENQQSIDDRISKIKSELDNFSIKKDKLIEKWKNEKKLVKQYHQALKNISKTKDHNPVSDNSSLELNIRKISKKLLKYQDNSPMVYPELDENIIATVVSDWTGIPVGRMVGNESDKILKLKENLSKNILGQEQAIQTISNLITIGKTNINDPKKPLTCLLIGQSGVGKTETAKVLSKYLFGNERYLTVINMSEYQEKHTVSKLTGSPPGYVGYGEGGILTEAVRQKPYSIVLLDEFEKAHPDVLKIFYQAFDEGKLSDGEGRVINFRNTIIILTTNQAHEEITKIFSNSKKDSFPDADTIVEQIRPVLSIKFSEELLARMTLIPYYPLSNDVISKIIHMKIDCLSKRLKEQDVIMTYKQDVIQWIASHCQVKRNGARNIEHVITSKLLPGISVKMLSLMKNKSSIQKQHLNIKIEKGNILFEFLDENLISKN